jgi:hypothetical protein
MAPMNPRLAVLQLAQWLKPDLRSEDIQWDCNEHDGRWSCTICIRLSGEPLELCGLGQPTRDSAEEDAAKSLCTILSPPQKRRVLGSAEPWALWGMFSVPHWCFPSLEDVSAEDNGLAVDPLQTPDGWAVWCYCGLPMQLSQSLGAVNMPCFCGGPAPPYELPGLCWYCDCGLLHQADVDGAPAGIPCSWECLQLRVWGHRLVDALGRQRANLLLNRLGAGAFHFARAGVADCCAAIGCLLEALDTEEFFVPSGPPPTFPVLWPTDRQ